MKVMWRPEAAQDFEDYIAQVGERSTRDAAEQKAAIESRILLLERFKDFGRKTRRTGVRELALDAAPVVIVFRLADGLILVLRIFGLAPQSAAKITPA